MIADRTAALWGLCAGLMTLSAGLLITLPCTNKEVSFFTEEESPCACTDMPEKKTSSKKIILFWKLICESSIGRNAHLV
jgi:hypothetical protein